MVGALREEVARAGQRLYEQESTREAAERRSEALAVRLRAAEAERDAARAELDSARFQAARIDEQVSNLASALARPGTTTRADHRVLAWGLGLDGVRHAVEPEHEVDQPAVSGGADGAGLGDVIGQCGGGSGRPGYLLGKPGEVDELGRCDRLVEAAGPRPLYG